ncbi:MULTISPECIES: bifunctional riboflavin kinase/FAD synthetase [Flavobacteriaceae]|uniref:bifunctional riboflavin kinase/FAD synthetase n=1 Tax=Flavobacteriaceae TaxID=49546 RepID=UPI00103DBA3E|nr:MULTISPECIES: bifunctional riboflavin kinase/FAD synthetase [Flavobacteriaceae]TBV25156.1 riboflavin biosynthesis protein RibF [Meridianimaribacter sp. CL38]
MKIYNSLTSYSKAPSVLTIGTFDGVHLGHQKIINRLITVAKEKNLESSLLTFFPHPRMVLQTHADIKLLNTIDERKTILSQIGIDNLIIKKFTQDFSRLSANDYVKHILVDELNVKHVIIGYDHRFGRNRSANIEDLKGYGAQFDFEVEEISVKDIEDVAISSTKIRNALNNGDVKTANTYLGYNYFLSGNVVKGKQIGSKIGFPTANVKIPEDYKLIPKNGAYVVQSNINNTTVYGMMNIGTNPTVNGKTQSIEVHFFNFNEDIYDTSIQVELIDRLRDEQKFDSVELLKEQLNKDKEKALTLFN